VNLLLRRSPGRKESSARVGSRSFCFAGGIAGSRERGVRIHRTLCSREARRLVAVWSWATPERVWRSMA